MDDEDAIVWINYKNNLQILAVDGLAPYEAHVVIGPARERASCVIDNVLGIRRPDIVFLALLDVSIIPSIFMPHDLYTP